jgi:acetylornithine/succinyldiaminopimelate/putrescine aminotransferase
MTNRQLFQYHVAQTSNEPIGLEIVSAEGNYLYDADGRQYIDMIGGISVCNIGHRHPDVVAAIKEQVDRYMHIMVYGEIVQSPQVQYAKLLTEHLPANLQSVYFTNSGAEAIEGTIKLARRYTGKTDIISCINSYHGSTTGALSIMGDEYWRNAFRPLMPGVRRYHYNSQELISAINNGTACVIIETTQAEAGVITPDKKWLQQLRAKCTETKTLLVFDDVQCGFGRTGKLWGFDTVVPDILVLGKALGGGMPLGAFISSNSIMEVFTSNPVLGHITTFGGHPVSCAAGMASFKVLLNEKLIDRVVEKEQLFQAYLRHPSIRSVRSKGLLIAVELENTEYAKSVVTKCIEKGIFIDWFLFAQNCLRIAPPLTITAQQIKQACATILSLL